MPESVNERLSRWAGTHHGSSWVDYEHSIDLIRRDLLPKLTEEQWAQLTGIVMRHKWYSLMYELGKHYLTLPPADLAAAIAEVVDAE